MMRRTTGLMACLAALMAAALFLFACASGADSGPKIDGQMGKHPAGWVNAHWADFLTRSSQCVSCHGSYTDKAIAGGISKVSCFSCHPNGISHLPGFGDSFRHGRQAAQKPPDDAPASMAGFSSCQKCHGEGYKGVGIAVSCMACHKKAPHPDRPWTAPSAAFPSHHMTADGNAVSCLRCHKDGANSTRVPAAPPAPGAQPGCFNNTLCHARDL